MNLIIAVYFLTQALMALDSSITINAPKVIGIQSRLLLTQKLLTHNNGSKTSLILSLLGPLNVPTEKWPPAAQWQSALVRTIGAWGGKLPWANDRTVK